jgi:hypothetical protein
VPKISRGPDAGSLVAESLVAGSLVAGSLVAYRQPMGYEKECSLDHFHRLIKQLRYLP